MSDFNSWFANIIGKLLKAMLEKAIDLIDPKQWLAEYADDLVKQFLDKFNADDVKEDLQGRILDPIKEWLENKLNVNL